MIHWNWTSRLGGRNTACTDWITDNRQLKHSFYPKILQCIWRKQGEFTKLQKISHFHLHLQLKTSLCLWFKTSWHPFCSNIRNIMHLKIGFMNFFLIQKCIQVFYLFRILNHKRHTWNNYKTKLIKWLIIIPSKKGRKLVWICNRVGLFTNFLLFS